MSFRVVNILDAYDRMEEASLGKMLSTFSCPKNTRIEHFLRDNAVSCARQRFAITYLAINMTGELAGFFTLTHKPVLFDNERLDGKRKRRVRQFCVRPLDAHKDENSQLLASAFLIAQLAKNSIHLNGETITGSELLKSAFQVLEGIQKSIGGGLVFLECEDEPKLLDFYEKNGFRKFGERDESDEGEFYHQLLRAF